jgi:hypothetical protein
MIEAPGWISCEVAGRSVVRSSRRVRIAGSGFGTCFRSFGFEFQGPCSAFTSWEVGREGEVARLKWSKFLSISTTQHLLLVAVPSQGQAVRFSDCIGSSAPPPWCKYDRAERTNNKE